ncbi:hypothetical protein [Paenibacillus sp. 1P07SE]|uniref:hypothetical protein n=1 Tax=Paenibacillus sp. 1P07SE TaxID=3132209 RepID=UPI0039A4AEA8
MIRIMLLSYLKRGLEESEHPVLVRELGDQQARAGQAGIAAYSAFLYGRYLCVYLEADRLHAPFDWDGPLAERLSVWPSLEGSRYSVRMTDIFHDGVPLDRRSWHEGRRIQQRAGSILRLKPEMAASYIFYHYQLQEEEPQRFNKTYLIGYYDNLIFSYQELPAAIDELKPSGALQTRNSPHHEWQERMTLHFQPWENGSHWESMVHLCTVEPVNMLQ